MPGGPFYIAGGADTNSGAMNDGTAQTAASRTDGWTVAKTAAGSSAMFINGTKQASGSFSSDTTTPKPPTGSASGSYCFKSPTALTGTYPAGTWTMQWAVRAASAAASQAGQMHVRIYAGTAATAPNREITTAVLAGTSTAALSTTADGNSTVSWAAPAFALNGEYLFIMIAWYISTASSNNSGDVVIRTGSAATTGSVITPTTFVPSTPVSGTDSNGTTTETAMVGVDSTFFPTTGILDNFNIGTGPLSANWTQAVQPVTSYQSAYVTNNQCTNDPNNLNASGAFWSAASYTDAECYYTLPTATISSGGTYTVFCRLNPGAGTQYNGNQSGYHCIVDVSNNRMQLVKDLGNGATTGISPWIPVAFTAGCKVGMKVLGGSIYMMYLPAGQSKWQILAYAGDSTYPGPGNIGLFLGGTSATIDDFGGGVPVVPPTPISGSDVNGATTESATFTGHLAGTDGNGATTDSASITHEVYVTADVNAVTTETTTLVKPVSITVYEPTKIGTYADFPVNFTTYAGIPGTYSTYAQIGTQLPLPNLVESALVTLNVSSADTNGTTTEFGAVPTFHATSADTNGTTTEVATFTYVAVGADVNGATTEASAVAVHQFLSGADANSSTTELAGLTSQLAGVDVNSSTTEAASTTVTPLQVSDANGATTESATAQVAVLPVSGTDANGTTTESGSTVVGASATDSNGSTVETATVQAGALVSASDSNGLLTEATIVKTTVAASDSGTESEVSSVTVAVSGLDANAGTIETATTNVPVSAADAGVGSDTASATSSVSAADTNSASVEIGTTTAGQITSSDTSGPTTETTTLGEINQVAGSDSGFGSDSAIATAAQILTTDSNGSTGETYNLSTLNQKADADSGSSQEVVSLFAQITPAGDVASATESASAYIYVYDVDAGIGVDAGAVTRSSIFDTDLGIGSDIADLYVMVQAADAGTAYEMGKKLFGDSDNGSGSDTASLVAVLNDYDSGYGAEVYNRWPPLTLFPPIPAGDILSAPMGEVISASPRGYIRNRTAVPAGTFAVPARGRILS